MITFEEALTIAKKIRPDIDGGTEFEKGYVFSRTGDDKYVGGPHSPVCILKSDGTRLPVVEFMMGHPGEIVKEFDL